MCNTPCRYATGDEGTAETCDSFCARYGRGHIHTMPCYLGLCSNTLLDGVRHHSDGALNTGAHKDGSVDEYTHDYFWERINFEDPCTDSERAQFRMCGSQCSSSDHDKVRLLGWY